MIKLFVSSFYNTLINEEDAIPTSTMFELDRIREQKIKFVILTNRLSEDVMYYNHDYPFIDYIISLNGSVIEEVETGKKTVLKPLNKKEVDAISAFYRDYPIIYYTEKSSYEERPSEDIYKIEIKTNKKGAERLATVKNIHGSILKDNEDYYMEYSKNTPYDALEKLLKKEKITPDEVLGIMGNESEKEIIENMKNIYLVRNAPKDLKDIAEHLTKTNKSKGVETVIKKEIK